MADTHPVLPEWSNSPCLCPVMNASDMACLLPPSGQTIQATRHHAVRTDTATSNRALRQPVRAIDCNHSTCFLHAADTVSAIICTSPGFADHVKYRQGAKTSAPTSKLHVWRSVGLKGQLSQQDIVSDHDETRS